MLSTIRSGSPLAQPIALAPRSKKRDCIPIPTDETKGWRAFPVRGPSLGTNMMIGLGRATGLSRNPILRDGLVLSKELGPSKPVGSKGAKAHKSMSLGSALCWDSPYWITRLSGSHIAIGRSDRISTFFPGSI